MDPKRLQKRLVFFPETVFSMLCFFYSPKTWLRIQTFSIYFYLDSYKGNLKQKSLRLHACSAPIFFSGDDFFFRGKKITPNSLDLNPKTLKPPKKPLDLQVKNLVF